MPMKLYRLSLLFICTLNTLTCFPYHVEHNGRIVNNSENKLTISYIQCDYTYLNRSAPPSRACSEERELTLNPRGQDKNYQEYNLDYYENVIDQTPPWRIIPQIMLTKVTYENHTTRFRTDGNDVDNDPKKPLSPWCYFSFGTGCVVLEKFGGIRYHCKRI